MAWEPPIGDLRGLVLFACDCDVDLIGEFILGGASLHCTPGGYETLNRNICWIWLRISACPLQVSWMCYSNELGRGKMLEVLEIVSVL